VSDKFAVLRECADQFEAQTIRIRLAAEKIPVLITGTDPNFALSLGGAATSRPVRVEVEHSDLERADILLKQDQLRATQTESWVCCRCHEQNAPTFDICWSCNKMHDKTTVNDQGQPVPSESKPGDKRRPEIAERLHRTDLGQDPRSTHEQALLADQTRLTTPSAPTPTGQDHETQTASVSRCARSAVVGILLFPPLLNFYSIYLLLNLDSTVYRNSDTRRRVWSVWIFNAAVISLGTTLWWLLFFRP
jgi:hypothetical protein